MKLLSKLSLREDARVLTPQEMKKLKGGSAYCRCSGESESFPVSGCIYCEALCRNGAESCATTP